VTPQLHRAHTHATRIVTSTPEGFRIPSDKVRIIGQGIDTDLFVPSPLPAGNATIVAVGRVSRRKSVALMVETLAWLKTHAPRHPFMLRFVGPTLTRDDEAYAGEIKALVHARGLTHAVAFDGPQPMGALPGIYSSAFAHLNLGETGSLDKAILESLACGRPTVTSNPAAFDVLSRFPDFIIRDRSPEAIGAQLCRVYERRHDFAPDHLRALVAGHHDLDSYTDRVWNVLAELVERRAA
jgi:glycosyltransferase involved in cell wall biosynthesis